MKILVISHTYLFPSDGRPSAGIFFANLLRVLKPKVERIVAVTPTAYIPGLLKRLRRFDVQRRIMPHQFWDGIEVYRPSYLSAGSRTHSWFQARMLLRSLLGLCEGLHRRHGFDLVLANGFCTTAHAAQRVAKAIGRRCIGWALGSDVQRIGPASDENLRLLKHNVRYTDLVLTVSDALRRRVLELCPDARHVHTFYRGIDLSEVPIERDNRGAREELGLDPGRRYMLCAGSVSEEKGATEFYRAFRGLCARWPDLNALWVGGGSLQGQLRRWAERDGLSGRLAVTGHVPRAKVLRYMQAADVLAFPSHAEGLPNVVMEALGVGLPVVATEVGGTPEVVLAERTGLLAPTKDVERLGAAVERCLVQPEWAARMAQAGQRLIREYFSVERNAPVLLSILQHVARGGRADVPLPCCAGIAPRQRPADCLRAPEFP